MSDKTYAEINDNGKDIAANLLSMKDLQIKKWQRVTMLSSLIALIAVGGMTYTATRATFIPYIVGVDEHTGHIQSLGNLVQSNIEPTPSSVNYFLSRFVEGVRSVSTDSNVVTANVNAAIRFLSPEAAQKFKSLYLSDLTKRIEKGANRVEIISITPVAGSHNTFQVRWKETLDDRGTPTTSYYVGIFTMEQQKISNESVLQYNPLGLFITDFSISEEAKGAGK